MYFKNAPLATIIYHCKWDEFSAKNETQRDMHEGMGSPGKDKES